MKQRYYVETQRDDGSWVKFTKGSFDDIEAVRVHLGNIKAWALSLGQDPERARIHEMTEDERKAEIIAGSRAALDTYLMTLPIEALEAAVERARPEPIDKNAFR